MAYALLLLGLGVYALWRRQQAPQHDKWKYGLLASGAWVLGLLMFVGNTTGLYAPENASPTPTPVQEQPQPMAIPVESPSVEARGTAVKLAQLQTAPEAAPQALIDAFHDILVDLSDKCPERPKRMGDVIYVGWQQLQKAGKNVTLLMVADGINKTITPGQTNCIEAAAAFVTVARYQ